VGILPKEAINKVSLAVLNSHPGRLPKYRGNYTIRWAIHNGDQIVVTVHFVDEGIDTGYILSEKELPFPDSKSIISIERKLDKLRAEELVKTLIGWLDGNIKPRVQNGQFEKMLSIQAPKYVLRTYLKLWSLWC